jgi:hypothetical protein
MKAHDGQSVALRRGGSGSAYWRSQLDRSGTEEWTRVSSQQPQTGARKEDLDSETRSQLTELQGRVEILWWWWWWVVMRNDMI